MASFTERGVQDWKHRREIERPGAGFWLWRAFSASVSALFRALWAVRVTLAWVLLAWLAWRYDALWLAVLALLAVGGWSVRQQRVRPFVPFWADVVRIRRRHSARAEQRAGERFLLEARIVKPETLDDGHHLPVTLREESRGYVLDLARPLPGIPPSTFAKTCDDFRSLLGAVRTAADLRNDGSVSMRFFTEDPLDEAQTRESPADIEPDRMVVPCAVDAFGKPLSLTFGDAAGMVVGGVPGSGKTAGVSSFLLPLALSPFVDLFIIDGKGGSDWEAYAPRAVSFIRGDEDLDAILAFIERFHALMLDRLQHQKERIGVSNFWGVPAAERAKAGERLEVLVIDECQGIFETNGRTKDEKETIARITRLCASLVKRGRSAGFFSIFLTQKPTADSLPTAIRDNASIRIAFRLTTAAAETAVLGVAPDDAALSARAVSIPSSRPGGAVIANDSGSFEQCRFFYVPEKVQTSLLSAEPVRADSAATHSERPQIWTDSEGTTSEGTSVPTRADTSENAQNIQDVNSVERTADALPDLPDL